ncbi:hypothetical protein DL93DRAFT_2228396 [Clavulina sp. PMI_390]|nr:hypothetical protein DL93DRAFT_2228396 [Clavulina sp. PMI_390]
MAHFLPRNAYTPRIIASITTELISIAARDLSALYKDDSEGFRLALDELIRRTIPSAKLPSLPPKGPLPVLGPFYLDTNQLEDRIVLEMTRFDNGGIDALLEVLDLPTTLTLPNRSQISARHGLFIALYRLAVPHRLSDISLILRRPVSLISFSINTVLSMVYKKWSHLLEFDTTRLTHTQLSVYAKAIYGKGCPAPNVWAFMDATIIAICRPTRNQQVAYNGYYRSHAMKFGCITTPDGIISHCSPAFEGRRGDGAIVSDTELLPLLREHARDPKDQQLFIYGDPAYGESDAVVSGLKRLEELTPEEQDLNKEMSRYRQAAEWSFGKVRSLWSMIDYNRKLQVELCPIGIYCRVAILMTNAHTCLYGSETSQYFNLPPLLLQKYFSAP